MTQQHFPAGPPDDRSPADPSAPPTGWAPTPLSDGARPSVARGPAAYGEPTAPLGSPPLPQVRIEEFAPPRSRLPLLVIAVAVLVAGLIWAGTTWRGQGTPAAPATPSVARSTPAKPSGLPFVSPDQRLAGRWEILRSQWTDSGLEVEIRVAADRGPITYSFLAFGNNDVEATSASPGSLDPKFTGMPIDSGQDETGWLFFPLERGPSTIILANGGGEQMSALRVAG